MFSVVHRYPESSNGEWHGPSNQGDLKIHDSEGETDDMTELRSLGTLGDLGPSLDTHGQEYMPEAFGSTGLLCYRCGSIQPRSTKKPAYTDILEQHIPEQAHVNFFQLTLVVAVGKLLCLGKSCR